jgi:hypothetical protein
MDGRKTHHDRKMSKAGLMEEENGEFQSRPVEFDVHRTSKWGYPKIIDNMSQNFK